MELRGLSQPITSGNNKWTGEFANHDPTKPSIKITDIHIDSSSDKFNSNRNYVGFIVYLCGGKDNFTLNNVNCRTGDIYIKDSQWILDNMPKRRRGGKYVHGRLFYSIFRRWRKKKLAFVSAGFSYHEGSWKFTSRTLNTMNPNNNDDGYHDTDKRLNKFEEELIQSVIDKLYTNHQWLKIEDRVNISSFVDVETRNNINSKHQGTAKWINYRRGYGFIKCGQFKEDIFVHCSGVLDGPTKGHFLNRGDNIEFNIVSGQKGLEAVDVTINESK